MKGQKGKEQTALERVYKRIKVEVRRNGRAGSSAGFSTTVRRAGPVQFGERPNWIDRGIQLGRLPSRIDSGIQLGRLPSWTSPVWLTAEMDRARGSARPFPVLGQSSSVNGRAGSTTNGRAVLVHFGERPSWIDQNSPSPRPRSSSPEIVSNSLLFRLDWRYHWNFTT
ncbi:hypothetical protein DY000_02052824 [Brassica cretica]|uniref:Uncharacterized protein n=1 Tax=Brassica cretica TaxID=69181 RepID=A0ABQ7A7S4_BRACR|nr:hypothetical protein DY000_02052824 [Brassica cretica]